MKILNFLTWIFIFVFSFNQTQPKILFVYEHFRHGTRSPGFGRDENFTHGNDLFGVKWKGNGEITKAGLRMHYLLGVMNRKKYGDLLSSEFDPKELLVFSTSVRRTVMSAQAQLYGMYPPITERVTSYSYNDKVFPPGKISNELKEEKVKLDSKDFPMNIQPIPIYVIDEDEAKTFTLDNNFCPWNIKRKEKRRQSKIMTQFFDEVYNLYGKQLMKFFHKDNPEFIYKYLDLFFICDTFLSDYENLKDLSRFEKEGIDLKTFYNISIEMKKLFLFHGENNQETSAIALSRTFPKIFNWMDWRINSDMNNKTDFASYQYPKFVMHSGHDTTLSVFLLFMSKCFNTTLKYPYYGSNLYFELHRNESSINKKSTIDDYYVEYIFNSELILRMKYTEFKGKVNRNLASKKEIRDYCIEENSLSFFMSLIVITSLLLIGTKILNKRIQNTQIVFKKIVPNISLPIINNEAGEELVLKNNHN